MLKGGKPVKLEKGKEVTITTDYTIQGDEKTIAMSYKKLPQDMRPGQVSSACTLSRSHRAFERSEALCTGKVRPY
jgi:hypothetical protein